MSMNKKEEPNTAPNPDRWYTLTLGSSYKDHEPSSKFCTLRYEFKPASIDKSQAGALHKTKDNKISVEFHNNQPGKPKVTFNGTSEDYKENDAVLFFDGHSFRLERLHRSVKRLRHDRFPSESASAALVASSAMEGGFSPMNRGVKAQPHSHTQAQVHPQGYNIRPAFTVPPPQPSLPPPPPPPVSSIVIGLHFSGERAEGLSILLILVERTGVEVERIDIGDAGNSGGNLKTDKPVSTPQQSNTLASPDSKDFDLEEHLDIMNDDEEDDALGPDKDSAAEKSFHTDIDINMPQQDTDDEIADVDVNDDNGVMGGNAAAALRAQVNAVEKKDRTSSSSASSESESSSSSESGSSSHSSSDSDSSDGDSVNSI